MKKVFIIIIKVLKRIKSLLKKCCWKIMYLNSFKCGKGTIFYPASHIVLDKDGKIEIGKKCFFNRNCSLNSLEKITIGNDCIFGENVCIYDHNHQYKNHNELIRQQGYLTGKIKIGNNCWIGSNVIILKGVTIGNNVVIAANSVVTKDIPENTIFFNQKTDVMKSII